MIFRIYGPDGFLCNVTVLLGEVRAFVTALQSTFQCPIIDFTYHTVEIK